MVESGKPLNYKYPSSSGPAADGEGRFVYGGIEFAMLGARVHGAAFETPSEAHFFRQRGSAHQPLAPGAVATNTPSSRAPVATFATLTCEVHGQPRAHVPSAQAATAPRALRWVRTQWQGARGTVQGKGVRARVRSLGARRFVASVDYRVSGLSPHPIEEVLSHALLERCGGFILHAAAIPVPATLTAQNNTRSPEQRRGVVAFVGPSGAGKTTAAALTGSPFFSLDKLAVAPMEDGQWWAWPLLGGSAPTHGVAAAEPALPLLGVLRVTHSADGQTRITDAPPHERMFLVRESVFGGCPEDPEADRLEHVGALCDVVPVGRIATVLGADPLAAIEGWL